MHLGDAMTEAPGSHQAPPLRLLTFPKAERRPAPATATSVAQTALADELMHLFQTLVLRRPNLAKVFVKQITRALRDTAQPSADCSQISTLGDRLARKVQQLVFLDPGMAEVMELRIDRTLRGLTQRKG